jgi:hypothetical protein
LALTSTTSGGRSVGVVHLWNQAKEFSYFLYHCYQIHINFSNILLSKSSPYVDEIIGEHQCGFRHNGSTDDQIFCIHQILEKKWEYNVTVQQRFIDFKKAYDSVRREVLYNILIEFVR